MRDSEGPVYDGPVASIEYCIPRDQRIRLYAIWSRPFLSHVGQDCHQEAHLVPCNKSFSEGPITQRFCHSHLPPSIMDGYAYRRMSYGTYDKDIQKDRQTSGPVQEAYDSASQPPIFGTALSGGRVIPKGRVSDPAPSSLSVLRETLKDRVCPFSGGPDSGHFRPAPLNIFQSIISKDPRRGTRGSVFMELLILKTESMSVCLSSLFLGREAKPIFFLSTRR